MKKSEIKLTVTLDENNLPSQINWEANDANEKSSCKSFLLSLWDAKENNCLRIDLWTKDMTIDDMKKFYHQTFLTMADTFERATGEKERATEIRDFGNSLADKMFTGNTMN